MIEVEVALLGPGERDADGREGIDVDVEGVEDRFVVPVPLTAEIAAKVRRAGSRLASTGRLVSADAPTMTRPTED